MSATIRTAIALISGEPRVFFEIPANGFGLDDLDALEVGIRYARRELQGRSDARTDEPVVLPEPCG